MADLSAGGVPVRRARTEDAVPGLLVDGLLGLLGRRRGGCLAELGEGGPRAHPETEQGASAAAVGDHDVMCSFGGVVGDA